MRVCLTVSDCPPLGGDERDLPDLPALARLATRGDRHLEPGGWRAAAWREAFGATVAPAPAVVAAWAIDLSPGTAVWLAQPVRLTAATDHLRLHGAGLLRVDATEAEAWVHSFESAFGGGTPRLRAIAGGFLLEGLEPSSGPPDPAESLGSRLDARVRGGSKALRRQVAEIELWLHEHPLNVRRQRGGRAAISALWVWGGGLVEPPPRGAGVRPLRIAGEDAFVVGLGAALGTPAIAPALDEVVRAASEGACLVQVSASVDDTRGEAPLVRIDREWIAPLVAAVEEGRIRALCVAIGGLRLESRRSHRLRWWRRSRPWWDTAAR